MLYRGMNTELFPGTLRLRVGRASARHSAAHTRAISTPTRATIAWTIPISCSTATNIDASISLRFLDRRYFRPPIAAAHAH